MAPLQPVGKSLPASSSFWLPRDSSFGTRMYHHPSGISTPVPTSSFPLSVSVPVSHVYLLFQGRGSCWMRARPNGLAVPGCLCKGLISNKFAF